MNLAQKHCRTNWLAALVLLLAGGFTQAQSLTTLAGHWNGINFDVPGPLILEKNGLGQVVNLQNRQNFEILNNSVDIAANGSFIGTSGGNAIAGAVGVGSQGVVTFTLPGQPVLSLRVNEAQDFLAAAYSPESSKELLLLLRAPAALAVADLAGQWNLLEMQTPAELVQLVQQPGGTVTDVQGANGFGSFTGTMTALADGSVTGTAETPFAGTLSSPGASQGTVTLTVTDGPAPLTLYVNAAKNLMVAVNEEFGGGNNMQEVLLFSRSPATLPVAADLQGAWKVNYFSTPAVLTLVRNGNVVMDIPEGMDFQVGQQSVTVGNDRFFTALLDQPAAGVFTIGAQGAIGVNLTNRLGEVSVVGFKLNAAKDTMLAVNSGVDGNEILVLTKSPAVPGNQQDFGVLLFGNGVVWAAGTDRKLQSTGQLPGGFGDVPGTTGLHEFKPTLGPTDSRFYRVTE